MVPRSVPDGDAPELLARVHVEGRELRVRGLEKWKAPRADQVPYLRPNPHVGALGISGIHADE